MISQTFKIKKFEGRKAVIEVSPDGPNLEVEGIDFKQFIIFRSEQLVSEDEVKKLLDALGATIPREKRVLLLPKFIEVCEFVQGEQEAPDVMAEAPSLGVVTAEGIIGGEPDVIEEAETDKSLDEKRGSGTGEISEGGVQEAGSGDNQVSEKE